MTPSAWVGRFPIGVLIVINRVDTVDLPSPLPRTRSGINEQNTAGRTSPGLSPPTRDVGFDVDSFQMGVAPRMGWGQVETRGETHAMGDPRGV